MPDFFQILNASLAEWLGGYTAKDADELKIGLLAKITSDGKLDATTEGDKADGFAYTNRTLVYAPTSDYAAKDEAVTLVRGHVVALVDSSFFYNATLPGFGALLYTAGNGKMQTSGTAGHLGKVIGTGDDIRTPPNTTKSVVKIAAHFGGKD